MKKTLKKVIKGTVAIFAIKFLFFTSSFFIQSCNSEDFEFEEDVDYNYNELVSDFKESLMGLSEKVTNEAPSLVGYSGNESNDDFSTINKKHLENLTEEEAKNLMKDVHEKSLLVLKERGLTNSEIINEFGSLDSPNISMAAITIISTEALAMQKGKTLQGFDETDFEYAFLMSNFGNTTYATEAFDCLIEALGVKAIMDLARGGIKKLGKKGAMKLIRKVATKYLGFVGAAIGLYEFGECMDWWGVGNKEEPWDLSFTQ